MTLNLPVCSLYRRPPLASLQCLCPVSHLAAQAQRAPVPVAPIAVHLRHHPESSSLPSSNASSPETSSSASTSRSTSPELLQMERSFNSLLVGTRDRQNHPVTRSQMDNLRDQQQRITVLKQVASQPQNQPRPVSVPPVANMPLPPYPRRRPCDKGSKSQVQAENAMLLVRAVTQRQTDYRTFKKSLVDALGHPVSRNWPSSSRPHQMKRRIAVSTTG